MSTNVFRTTYRELSFDEKLRLEELKDKAELLLQIIHDSSTDDNGRHMALAKTALEESVMWAVKGITG